MVTRFNILAQEIILYIILSIGVCSNLLSVLLPPEAEIDYSFNLDDNEGVCDLFEVQILNY